MNPSILQYYALSPKNSSGRKYGRATRDGMDKAVALVKSGHLGVLSADGHVTISDGFHDGDYNMMSCCDPHTGTRRLFSVQDKKKQGDALLFYLSVEPMRQKL